MLAARIVVSNLHASTKTSFSETIKYLYYHVCERSGLKAPLIADDVYEIIMKVPRLLSRQVEISRPSTFVKTSRQVESTSRD
ncbi:ribonucleotide-diphosphate reductase subunit rnr1 [Orobanche hederae]